jgi:hypothetical protein
MRKLGKLIVEAWFGFNANFAMCGLEQPYCASRVLPKRKKN